MPPRSTALAGLLALGVVLALPARAPAQAWFDAPRILTEVGNVLAVADLDGDGDPDLAAKNGAQLVLMRNDGAGAFTAGPAVALDPASSLGAEPARLGDTDGDGLLDLVMTAGNAMHVYRGLPGGGFAPVVAVPLPVQASCYDLGDMNADGRVDIAIGSTFAQQVGWVSFNGATYQTTGFPAAGDFVAEVAALDFDNDGADDLVASMSDWNRVLLVRTVAGQPVPGATLTVGANGDKGAGLAGGDLDGDGDDDLAVLYNDSSDLTTVVVENVGGNLIPGSIHVLSNAGFEVQADGVLLADWDADGDLDVATQTLLQIAGQGRTRGFLIENTTGRDLDAVYEVPVSALGWVGGVADFDGDGALDLATAGSIRHGDGTFAGFPLAIDLSVGATAALVDFEGDGDLDVRYSSAVSFNDATGALTTVVDLLPDPGPGLDYRAWTWADFDGDGIGDVVAETWQPSGSVFVPDTFIEMRFLKGLGTGAYAAVGPAVTPGVHVVVAGAADYDLDGDVDLLSAFVPGGLPAAIWRNSGSGTFPFTLPAPAGTLEDQADIDQDGDVDLLTRSGNALLVHRNLGGGAFQSTTVVNQDSLDAGSRLLDLDADGDLDVVAHTYVSDLFGKADTLRLVENAGAGFLAPVPLDVGTQEMDAYGVADVDGDGVTDLLAAATTNDIAWTEDTPFGRVLVFRRVAPAPAYAPPKWFIGYRPAAFADMDGDGDVDVLGSNFTRSRRFEGPSAGLIRQFGAGTPGSGGAVPTIGAHGPARVGSASYELRLVHGLGGGAALLVLGTQAIDLANAPVLGAHFYVGNLILTLPLTLPGPSGAAGQGGFVLPAPIAPSLLGLRVVHQTLHADPGAQWGVSSSNGLEVVFGG